MVVQIVIQTLKKEGKWPLNSNEDCEEFSRIYKRILRKKLIEEVI